MEKSGIDQAHMYAKSICMQKELKYSKRGNFINYNLNKNFKLICEEEKSFDYNFYQNRNKW